MGGELQDPWRDLCPHADGLTQPYVQQSLDLSGLGAGKSISNGFFNTIVSPYNLSCNFHPFFIKSGIGIYPKDGYYQSNTLSSDVKVSLRRRSPTISGRSSRI